MFHGETSADQRYWVEIFDQCAADIGNNFNLMYDNTRSHRIQLVEGYFAVLGFYNVLSFKAFGWVVFAVLCGQIDVQTGVPDDECSCYALL